MAEELDVGDGATGPVRVEVTRSGRIESVHEVDLAVMTAGADAVLRAGRPEKTVFVRSAIKPFQALPLLEDGIADRWGFSDDELALCCASHSGEEHHVDVARSILARIGLDEDALACGPHPPFSREARERLRQDGLEPGRLHNNCSGKHGGMLALAVGHGWPMDRYHELEHPVQQRVLDEVERWTGVDRSRMDTGVDGCGVVTVALPLTTLAVAFARLMAAAQEGGPAGRMVDAMARHPSLVGGSGRLCTAIMEATEGRIIAKVGAEGVYAAATRDRAWGIALKVRDGARRAAEVALVGCLESLGLLGPEELEGVERWRRPVLRNTRDEVVGGMGARLEAWNDD